MKHDLEMKEENEIILKRWRNIGFLNGLKEGSQNEWRCAKSFELMAQYLTSNEWVFKDLTDAQILSLKTIPFPIIRRVLCSNRPKVNRIIQPEEIIDTIFNTRFNEAFESIHSGRKETKTYEYTKKILEYYNLYNSKIVDILTRKKIEVDMNVFNNVFDIDVDAEITTVLSKYLTIKLSEK